MNGYYRTGLADPDSPYTREEHEEMMKDPRYRETFEFFEQMKIGAGDGPVEFQPSESGSSGQSPPSAHNNTTAAIPPSPNESETFRLSMPWWVWLIAGYAAYKIWWDD